MLLIKPISGLITHEYMLLTDTYTQRHSALIIPGPIKKFADLYFYAELYFCADLYFFVSYFSIVIKYIRIRYECLYFVARYKANVSHIGSLKRSLKCFPRSNVMTNTYKEQLRWHLWWQDLRCRWWLNTDTNPRLLLSRQ